jgi:hypothetical protein
MRRVQQSFRAGFKDENRQGQQITTADNDNTLIAIMGYIESGKALAVVEMSSSDMRSTRFAATVRQPE